MQRLEWMRGGREPHWVAGGVCPRVPASLIPGWRLYGDAAPHHAHRHAHPCPAVLAGRAASTRQPALAPASPCERTYRGGCTRTGPRHRPTHPPSDLAGTAQPVRHRHVGRVLGCVELRLTRTPSTDTDRPGGQLDALCAHPTLNLTCDDGCSWVLGLPVRFVRAQGDAAQSRPRRRLPPCHFQRTTRAGACGSRVACGDEGLQRAL